MATPAAASSPDSCRSQLSLDDLVDEGSHPKELADATSQNATMSFANDTKRVEAKLQLNLQQQQEHYERQRKLFEALGRDSLLGISPTGEEEEMNSQERPRRSRQPSGAGSTSDDDLTSGRGKKFQLQFQQVQRELSGVDEKRKVQAVEKRALRRASESDPEDEIEGIEGDDTDFIAIERLQRKAKSIASYHSRIAHSAGLHFTRGSTKAASQRPQRYGSIHRLDESASHFDASNEALRKQLELLRRLQLENNRFRHENRSLREQNDVLEEQTTLHTREIKRLQDEVQELSLRVQHDQLELATAAQNARKIKQLQKQLDALQSERDQLQTELQEAKDHDAQLRLRTQNEIESVVQETKHLKRSLKQARQQETRLQTQIEELKEVIAVGEKTASELQRQLLVTQRESSEIATRLSEKTTRVEAIESSASQCVERMEAGMEALQKAHNSEREKRKKLEKLRESLQSEMGTLELEHSKLQERVHELESYNGQLQQRLQDWKLEQKQDKKFQDEKLHEFQERHKSDTKTITMLREDCATYEQQLETTRTTVVEIRKEVATECNAIRKDVEALRNYVEDAQRAPLSSIVIDSRDRDASNEPSLASGGGLMATQSSSASTALRSRREELWVQLPELQFLQGALGGLRNEAMNFVGEFQRTRHQLRQHAAQLTAAQEKLVELEHLRSEDALSRKELEDQRLLAEQSREITLREKMEVLTWSQQACEKSEQLETALNKCAASVQSVVKNTRRVLATVATARRRSADKEDADKDSKMPVVVLSSKPEEDPITYVARLVTAMEGEVQELTARVETLVDDHKASIHESEEQQQRITRLQKEVEAQRQDHVAVVAEIEALHTRTVSEKQQLFRGSLKAVESERDTLLKALAEEREAVTAMQSMNEALDGKLAELEQDVPVLTTITQLFALVVPPLVLQVNDLLTQKRVLMRENGDYAAAHEQVECIGQVLRELVPAGGTVDNFNEHQRRQRRRQFRRVLIAVFAINRFQRGGFSGCAAGTGETAYGVCTSLKPSRKKKAGISFSKSAAPVSSGGSSSCLPPQTMIKVLPPKPLLARLDLRATLDRLREMDLRDKLVEVADAASTSDGTNPSSFGSLLMQVLSVMDPSNKEILVEDTTGTFHCRALLERRKATRWQDGSPMSPSDHDDARLSTVDLIRKRILALGKRLEDLHYQRNALQKENYDFQFQIDQQATQLREMDVLSQKNAELQHEMEQLQEQHANEATGKATELAERNRDLENCEQRISRQHDQIAQLEKELASMESRIAELELEKTDLHHALLVAKSASAAEEEKLHKSRIGMDKQAEELRALKQAAKRAHELHERVAWQLEQELVEKASLQAMMDHLRKQKETLEREVAHAKVHALDESMDADIEDDNGKQAARTKTTTGVNTSTDSRLGISTSSTSSYERQLQDLSDRIANMRTAASAAVHNDDDDVDEVDQKTATKDEGETQVLRRKPGTKSVDAFRSEWQRLDISGVFGEEGSTKVEENNLKSQPAHANNEHDVADPTRRRGDEIDKVNSAVHDYMDRIDEKLQQMYGIPKSSNRLRPPSTASIIHGTAMTKSVSKKAEVRWGDTSELE